MLRSRIWLVEELRPKTPKKIAPRGNFFRFALCMGACFSEPRERAAVLRQALCVCKCTSCTRLRRPVVAGTRPPPAEDFPEEKLSSESFKSPREPAPRPVLVYSRPDLVARQGPLLGVSRRSASRPGVTCVGENAGLFSDASATCASESSRPISVGREGYSSLVQ